MILPRDSSEIFGYSLQKILDILEAGFFTAFKQILGETPHLDAEECLENSNHLKGCQGFWMRFLNFLSLDSH